MKDIEDLQAVNLDQLNLFGIFMPFALDPV